MSISGSSLDVPGPSESIIDEIQSSMSLKFAIVSVIMIIIGGTLLKGVWAGMFGVFGASFLLVSLSIYIYLWYGKRSFEEDVEETEI